MRTKTEIMDGAYKGTASTDRLYMLEVLIDIRDALVEANKEINIEL